MGGASDVIEYDRITPELPVKSSTPHETRHHQYREKDRETPTDPSQVNPRLRLILTYLY